MKKSKSRKYGKTIQEYLGVPANWPLKEDIKHEIVLMPNRFDIKGAKRNEPQACALHNAACRMFDIPNCAIGGFYAYIPQRDAKGKYYIARMHAPSSTRTAIRIFDKTGEMPEGGFRFTPLSSTQKLSHQREYMRSRYHDIKSGTHKPRTNKKPKRQRIAPLRAMPTSFHE